MIYLIKIKKNMNNDLPEYAIIINNLNEEFNELQNQYNQDTSILQNEITDLKSDKKSLLEMISENILESLADPDQFLNNPEIDINIYLKNFNRYKLEIISILKKLIKEFNNYSPEFRFYYSEHNLQDINNIKFSVCVWCVSDDDDDDISFTGLICPENDKYVRNCECEKCIDIRNYFENY